MNLFILSATASLVRARRKEFPDTLAFARWLHSLGISFEDAYILIFNRPVSS